MRLDFRTTHRSIRSLDSIDLPEFTVLTGLNGSGKTHLLEAIAASNISISDIPIEDPKVDIRLFDWTTLLVPDSGAVEPHQIWRERYSLWEEARTQLRQHEPRLLTELGSFGIDTTNVATGDLFRLDIKFFQERFTSENDADAKFQQYKNSCSSAIDKAVRRAVGNDANRKELVQLVEQRTGKRLPELDDREFIQAVPLTWKTVDMFQQSFGELFSAYQKVRQQNLVNEWRASRGEDIYFLDHTQFLTQYGEPPWDFVNAILDTARLDFRIIKPSEELDRPYRPALMHLINGQELTFADISSGEKILMSLALCLYYANDRRQVVRYPKVLLFDEVDAPLHPSMTQTLLDTIQETLIERHGINVMLATHSPSTVALAPENSIYVMQKDRPRLRKGSRDEALKILTTGVPTLSVSYENRRQVFVESKYDVQYYEKVYECLADYTSDTVSLNFIASSPSSGGSCDNVKAWVSELRKGGMKTIFGVVDWDLSNKPSEGINVLGHGQRYSIENYILDPILLACLIVREKFHSRVSRADLGLDEQGTWGGLDKANNPKLQAIADIMLTHINTSRDVDNTSLECALVGGASISLPAWFREMRGHNLECAVKNAFPELQRYRRENELKTVILNKVAWDLPLFLSRDVLKLFVTIENQPL